jgi:hypothetical protein
VDGPPEPQTYVVPGKIKQVNKISGPSLANSSSNSSSSKKLTKKSDVIEPFKEVNDKIADMEREINRASKAADRLWGDARIAQIEKENKAIQKNIGLLKDKRAEAEYRTEKAKQDLISIVGKGNAKFDANGNFLMYDEYLEPLYA